MEPQTLKILLVPFQLFARIRYFLTALSGRCMSPCRADYLFTLNEPRGLVLRSAWSYALRLVVEPSPFQGLGC